MIGPVLVELGFSCFAREAKAPSRSNRIRPVAQLAERRSPKPQVGGSIPSWPANSVCFQR